MLTAYRGTIQVVLVIKNSPDKAGEARDGSLIPGSVKSPGGGLGNPLQYSGPENSMDREAWRATVHGVAKSRTGLKQLSTHARDSSRSTFTRSTLKGQPITQPVLISHKGKVSTLSMLNGQLINGRASFPTSDTELFRGLIHHWVGEKNE